MNRCKFSALALLAPVLMTVSALSGCGNRAADKPPANAAAPSQALQLAAADVVNAAVQPVAHSVAVSGSIKAVNSAIVKARALGELKSLTVREGEMVHAGQVIGQIDAADYDLRLRQTQDQAQAARAQADIAERNYANSKALVEQGFISPTALATAQASAAGARATLQAASAAADLARKARADATLVAPISGQISQRLAQVGERVAPEARIVEIVDLSRLELEAALSPADVAQLRVGAQGMLKVDGVPELVPVRVARINPAATAASRAVPVYLSVAAHPALRQGLFGQGRVVVSVVNTLALPTSTIRRDQPQPYVVGLANGKAVWRHLDLGAVGYNESGEELVAIRGGLANGDVVLAGRAGLVAEGTPLRLPAAAAPATPAAAASAAASPAAPGQPTAKE